MAAFRHVSSWLKATWVGLACVLGKGSTRRGGTLEGVQVTPVRYVPVGFCWVSTEILLSHRWDRWLNLSQHHIFSWSDRIVACAITVATVPWAPETEEEPRCLQALSTPTAFMKAIEAGPGPCQAERPLNVLWNLQL